MSNVRQHDVVAVFGVANCRTGISRLPSNELRKAYMSAVGVIARFEAKAGTEQEMERFFQGGRAIVEEQPASTMWFAFRVDPTTYGAFAAFASEADRSSLLAAGGPKLSKEFAALFVSPPTFEMVSIIESRHP